MQESRIRFTMTCQDVFCWEAKMQKTLAMRSSKQDNITICFGHFNCERKVESSTCQVDVRLWLPGNCPLSNHRSWKMPKNQIKSDLSGKTRWLKYMKHCIVVTCHSEHLGVFDNWFPVSDYFLSQTIKLQIRVTCLSFLFFCGGRRLKKTIQEHSGLENLFIFHWHLKSNRKWHTFGYTLCCLRPFVNHKYGSWNELALPFVQRKYHLFPFWNLLKPHYRYYRAKLMHNMFPLFGEIWMFSADWDEATTGLSQMLYNL